MVQKWASQPRLSCNGVHAGDFLLCANTLLSGAQYRKICRLLKFMNIKFPGMDFYNYVQSHYAIPVIDKYWEDLLARNLLKYSDKIIKCVICDGRCDSPGHCAEYCTYVGKLYMVLFNHY